MENVLGLMKRDHDEVSELFTEIRRLIREDVISEVDVRASFQKLKQALVSHLNAEEEAVYAKLKGKEVVGDYAHKGAIEHGLALDLLEKMSNDAIIGEAWKAQFSVLRDEIERHVEDEELELFPLMRDVFTSEELAEMGKDMRALKVLVQDTAFAPSTGLKIDATARGGRPDAPDFLHGV